MKLTILQKRTFPLLLSACGLILAACSAQTPAPTETPTPFSTETPTPTIVWFPPTNTPTVFPTVPSLPTTDLHPGVGDLIFSDSFDQPELWDTATTAGAEALLTRNRLILSVNGTGPLSILSLRSQPVMGDFYAEAMAEISLCGGKDQYGMLFRASGKGDYYRFTVNCSGQMRLESVTSGVAYPLNDWLSSGDIPSGAPAQVKIGIWAVGREMRIFLNDHFQFSLVDRLFSNGQLGFFAFASGETPVTVSFSTLSVYTVFYISPIPSLTPSRTPIPTRTPIPSQTPTP